MGKYLDIDVRMKEYYEVIPKTKLMRRTPVIVRIDGRAFHTFTRGFKKPFDDVLIKAMQETTKCLCESIQGCVMGYTQSDEITLVLVDYKELNSSAFFDYEVQKLCSIIASMTTKIFNKEFQSIVYSKFVDDDRDTLSAFLSVVIHGDVLPCGVGDLATYLKALSKGAEFDARCFNIPKEEVTNCVYWRQMDAIRNSIQMCGQANFSQKCLNNKSRSVIIEMLDGIGFNWNSLPVYKQRGTSVIKRDNSWVIDKEMPVLKGEGRDYVESLINFN